jgi:hypothetical protein
MSDKKLAPDSRARVFFFDQESVRWLTFDTKSVAQNLGLEPLPKGARAKQDKRIAPVLCEKDQKFYDELFAQDELRITIALGYLDEMHGLAAVMGWEPVPYLYGAAAGMSSRYLRAFVDHGFVAESFTPAKVVMRRTVVHRGQEKKVTVTLLNPNGLCKDESYWKGLWNRSASSICEEQVRDFTVTKSAFEAAFASDQVVIYNGHSRSGRGPDFGPYSFGQRVDVADVFKIAARSGRLRVFAHLGCKSDQYHLEDVKDYREQKPEGEFLFVRNNGAPEFQDTALTGVSLILGLIEEKCIEDIEDVSNTLLINGGWPNRVLISPL